MNTAQYNDLFIYYFKSTHQPDRVYNIINTSYSQDIHGNEGQNQPCILKTHNHSFSLKQIVLNHLHKYLCLTIVKHYPLIESQALYISYVHVPFIIRAMCIPHTLKTELLSLLKSCAHHFKRIKICEMPQIEDSIKKINLVNIGPLQCTYSPENQRCIHKPEFKNRQCRFKLCNFMNRNIKARYSHIRCKTCLLKCIYDCTLTEQEITNFGIKYETPCICL